MRTIIKATMTQHPVGQGGMFSGRLENGDAQTHWVYDCGSNQTEALKREIGIVRNNGAVDLLFLSHLDSDHISGIDLLTSGTPVKEVVLPYLNDHDRMMIICCDSVDGLLTGNFLSFAADPAAWLLDRGVERVTFVNPRDDDAEGGEGPNDGRLGWSRDRKPVTPAAQQNVATIATEATICVGGTYPAEQWLLALYAHKPSSSEYCAFLTALENEFGKQPSLEELIEAAKTSVGRVRLRNCYNHIWKDYNLVSMSLFSGPIKSHLSGQNLWDICWNTGKFKYQCRHWEYQNLGWLSTGDAQLKRDNRRKCFLKHYEKLLCQVDVFVLPHHGSCHSFHPDLLRALPRTSLCIAATGANGYGHPHRSVREAVNQSGSRFVKVSNVPDTVATIVATK
jgi:beta-lactamase superfamily II metal-dependent hydrolase